MKPSKKEQNEHVSIVLRRMRESAGLTMREVGAMIGVSHVAISQFENRKLDLPSYRIEQLVNAYGLSMADFNKILGRTPVVSPKDDCHAMIDRIGDDGNARDEAGKEIKSANIKISFIVLSRKYYSAMRCISRPLVGQRIVSSYRFGFAQRTGIRSIDLSLWERSIGHPTCCRYFLWNWLDFLSPSPLVNSSESFHPWSCP